jgi:uncharacterized protein YbcI
LSIKDIASPVAWRYAGSRPISNHAGAVVKTSLGSGTTAFPERGQLAAQISREVVQLHARLYGRGPTKARTYVERDYVMCVLEEVFTVAEKTLIRAGNGEQVTATRIAFQDAMQSEFVGLVEEATNRRVRAFVSQVHIDAGLAVEIFLLSEADA